MDGSLPSLTDSGGSNRTARRPMRQSLQLKGAEIGLSPKRSTLCRFGTLRVAHSHFPSDCRGRRVDSSYSGRTQITPSVVFCPWCIANRGRRRQRGRRISSPIQSRCSASKMTRRTALIWKSSGFGSRSSSSATVLTLPHSKNVSRKSSIGTGLRLYMSMTFPPPI